MGPTPTSGDWSVLRREEHCSMVAVQRSKTQEPMPLRRTKRLLELYLPYKCHQLVTETHASVRLESSKRGLASLCSWARKASSRWTLPLTSSAGCKHEVVKLHKNDRTFSEPDWGACQHRASYCMAWSSVVPSRRPWPVHPHSDDVRCRFAWFQPWIWLNLGW